MGQLVPGLLKLAVLPDEELQALIGSLLEATRTLTSSGFRHFSRTPPNAGLQAAR